MGYITLAFLITATIIGVYLSENLWNPLTLFFGFWSCLIFLALLHLYNFYSLKNSTYAIFFMGLFSVFIGYFLGYSIKDIRFGPKKKYTYEKKIMMICCIFIMIFIIFRLLMLVKMLASGLSWWNLRLIASGNESGETFLQFWGSNLMYSVYTYIIAPIIYMLAPMFVIMLYIPKYRDKKLMILMVIDFVLFSIMTVSRNLMSFLVVYIIIGFICFQKYKSKLVQKTIKKMKKYIPIIVVVLISGIWYISALRNTEEDILETLYIYLIGGLPSFEYRIEHYSYPKYTLGLYTLRGFFRPILYILHLFGFDDPERYKIVIDIASDCEQYIPIGYNVRMNAYATIFYSLYRDGGYIGIIVGSIIFGILCRKIYKSMITKSDLRSMVLYFLIIQQIFFSMARFYFVFPTRALSYIWVFLLLRKAEDN